jgi:hypothetical protein
MGNKIRDNILRETLDRLSAHEIHQRNHPLLQGVNILFFKEDYSRPALMRKTISCDNFTEYQNTIQPLL